MRAVGTFFVLLMLATGISCRVEPVRFDSAKWKAGDALVRRHMAQDIADRKLLNGRSRNEVIQFLGTPDHSEATFFAYNVDDSSRIVRYFLTEEINMIVVFDESTQTVKGVDFADR